MKTRGSYEAVSERKAIPPLSQSRYGDMACETLYVQKHVQGAIWGNQSLQHEGLKSTKSWQATSTTSSERGAPATSKYSTP